MPTKEIQEKFQKLTDEMSETHLERRELLRGLGIALIAKQHLLMLGPGGTGKSFLTRDLASRIIHDNGDPLWNEYADVPQFNGYFEKALDETSTPDEVFGPPDIKAMAEEGKTRRVYTGMLPEAIVAFLDEFFNSNGPTLHSIMPALNERLFHNNGIPMRIPLWTCFMGTNKLNADEDYAALWDRVHLRFVVKYIQDRVSKAQMVRDAIERELRTEQPEKTTLNLNDLRTAHEEAMNLEFSESARELFFDIHDALQHQGIIVGDRRVVQGAKGVLASAYLAGHDEVKAGDLDILQHYWWVVQDQIDATRQVVLSATNPGEKQALDMLDDLDKLNEDIKQTKDMDNMKRNASGLEVFKQCQKLLKEAEPLREKAEAAGASTARIDELIDRTNNLMTHITKEIFGIDPAQAKRMQQLTE